MINRDRSSTCMATSNKLVSTNMGVPKGGSQAVDPLKCLQTIEGENSLFEKMARYNISVS